MALSLQDFINQVTVLSTTWLNQVDVLLTTVFQQASTNPQARAALMSDLPLEIVNGGTASRTAAGALVELGALPASSFTAAGVAAVLYPQTPAEIAAGVVPASYLSSPGNIN